jgi:hypothetical protein
MKLRSFLDHGIPKSSKAKRGLSAIIAAILIMGMILTVTFTYFYVTSQDQQIYEQAVKAHQQSILQQNQENLLVYGAISGTILGFYVNDSGASTSIVAYWIYYGSTGAIAQYQNTTNSGGSLPFYVGQGASVFYSNTNVVDNNPYQQYVIKVLTSRGNTFVGTYPSSQLSTTSLNSLIAGGLGSLQMTFTSFSWYSYISGPQQVDDDNDFYDFCSGGVLCNGGNYIVDINHPHSGSLAPEGNTSTILNCPYGPGICGTKVPMVFSVQITNEDPTQATLVINSEANLWVVQTCDSGVTAVSCPKTNPVYVFYVMNLNPKTGAVTSLNSFNQITIPYGNTTTLYFGSAYDLSTHSFQEMDLTTDDSVCAGCNQGNYGQFAVFLLFAGTKIPPQSVMVYGQNIPFESTIAADNLGWYSEQPFTCLSNTPNVFLLTVNNSAFSEGNITQVVLNASAFTSVSATAPTGWNLAINQGVINWTYSNKMYWITPGNSLNFAWYGVAPPSLSGTQLVFPLSLHWGNGQLTALQQVESCFDSNSTSYAPTIPPGAIAYVPIYLFNVQNTGSSSGTQIMLNMNWKQYNAYLDNSVDNVLFFDQGGHILNSWMENGTSKTSTNSIVWVNMGPDTMGSYGATTIYMAIYPKGTSQLSSSGPFGEAPQLSPSYGQYDDGSLVFSAYANGNTAISQFKVASGNSLIQTTGVTYGAGKINALELIGTGTKVTMVLNTPLSNLPTIGESNFESGATSIAQGTIAFDDSATPSTSQNAIGLQTGSGSFFSQGYEISNSYTFGKNSQGSVTSAWNYASTSYLGSATSSWTGYIAPQLYSTQGGYSGTYNNNPLSGSSKLYLSILTNNGGAGAMNMYFNWLRARIAPPNGIMPIVVFGQVTP